MQQQIRCKKCGRVLKSLQSIAMRMGSTCAGVTIKSGKDFSVQIRQSSGKPYLSMDASDQNTIISSNFSSKPLSKRESIQMVREERRRLFEERKPFQCGVLANAHTPLIYLPSADGRWKENSSGRVISHERLQEYLKKYNFI